MASVRSTLELFVEEGPRAGESVIVDQTPFLIGRDQSAHLFIDDPAVSRLHVGLIYREDQWILQDLGGVNPPLVHGRAAVSLPLRCGDVIQIGAHRVRVARIAVDPERVGEADGQRTVDLSVGAYMAAMERSQVLGGRRLWQLLSEWTNWIRSLDDIESLIEKALDGLFRVIPADRGGIYRLDPKSGGLVEVATRHLEDDDPIGARRTRNAEAQYSETIVGRAIRARRARLYSPDIEAEASNDPRPRSMIRKRIFNALCVPMLEREVVRGVVYLDQTDASRPPLMPEDLELCTLLTSWLAEAIDKAERFRDLDHEVVQLRQRSQHHSAIIGNSEAIQKVRRRIERVAQTDLMSVITGESGTGKELVARAIHDQSSRRANSFSVINCGAYTEERLDLELFGSAKGSDSSGDAGVSGRLEQIDGGTILFDDVDAMPLSVQTKLLRLIDEQKIQRIGGNTEVPVDVRVLVSTTRDLDKEVELGRFREALYYRLNVFPIHVPPLRRRTEDIRMIAESLLARLVDDGRTVTISPRAIERLQQHSYPGNVRELKNILVEALVAGDGRSINPRDLSFDDERRNLSFRSLRDVERDHVRQVLEAVNGNKKKAAEMLGIHRSTLYEKLAEYRFSES